MQGWCFVLMGGCCCSQEEAKEENRNTLLVWKGPFQGANKSFQVRLNLTCWKCFASERATGKANSTPVFCQYGSLKLAHQTCRMSQGRRNNIITSVHAEMTTWGQMRLACARNSREEKILKKLQTRVWIVLHNQFLTFQLHVLKSRNRIENPHYYANI